MKIRHSCGRAKRETPHSVDHDLTFFTYNDAKQAYDEVAELHHEQTYSMATYERLLQQAGFQSIQVTADFGRQPVAETTTRWFFVCDKGAR